MQIRRELLQQLLAGSDSMLLTATRQLVVAEHGYIVNGLPADLLDEMIRNALATARSLGLQSPPDCAAFVLWSFEFGPEFHRHPAVQALLGDATLAPEQKMSELATRVPEQVLRSCEAALPRMTWFPELRTLRSE